MKIINVANFDTFEQLYQDYEEKKSQNDAKGLVLLFVASTDPETEQSWCSDCRDSKVVIDKAIDEFRFNDQLTLAIIDVGPRDEWKSSNNPFRLHKLNVEAVPTLMSLKTGFRLVEADCKDVGKVSHLFSNSM